jgi:copper chaperone
MSTRTGIPYLSLLIQVKKIKTRTTAGEHIDIPLTHRTEGVTLMNQKFQVTGMSCGHCANAVKKAVQAVDPEARTTVDLEKGYVDVVSEHPRADIVTAIEDAGYDVK